MESSTRLSLIYSTMSKQKELIFDIEISPNVGSFWRGNKGGLHDVSIIDVQEHSQVLSVAYKWRGSTKIYKVGQCDFKGYKKNIFDDKDLVQHIRDLFDEADVVIGQNSDKFDIKFINTRCIVLGIAPPSGYQTLDTLKINRKHFMHLSNSLDFVSKRYGFDGKIHHEGFMPMVAGCRIGDMKYWNMLKKYNGGDIDQTERVLDKVLPWTRTLKPIWQTKKQCPNCDSYNVQSRGLNKSGHKRYSCTDCLKADKPNWFLGQKIIERL